jgi:hypothetical protein
VLPERKRKNRNDIAGGASLFVVAWEKENQSSMEVLAFT